jgi:type II secretory ATPase GspE/PulE/Tfp pilus assembly ATPase PilB-like protein
LGQVLVDMRVLSERELEAALAEQRATGGRIGEVLVRRGLDAEPVARALAGQLRLEYAEPPLRLDDRALAIVGPEFARRHGVLPLAADERVLRVAISDPLDAAPLDALRFRVGRRVEPVVATRRAIEAAFASRTARNVEAIVRRLPRPRHGAQAAEEEPVDVAALRRALDAAPIVALVDHVLERAVAAGASDVHVEPAGDRLAVRIRVDGVLRELVELPPHAGAALASRLKVMADLDIAVKRRPQDGRAAVRIGERELALRVSTLPSVTGEKTVVRILDPANAERSLAELGMSDATARAFRALLDQPHGVILVTGPTGSGKTTTLYAALRRLDRATRNVVTLEDPVEYRLAGLTQVQVHRKAGLGFAAALRSVLRQDPDIIMVGELRDRETAETAMAAALTGHLVLSTLHTNDAPSAIGRLADMGAPAWLISAGLIGVLAQRLARRLCPHCASTRAAGEAELAEVGLPRGATRLGRAHGCARCGGSGYAGRIGVFELLVVDAAVRQRIGSGPAADGIREAALAAGMVSLAQDAWRKVSAGETTIEEVRPLLRLLAREAPACPACGGACRAAFRTCPWCGTALRPVCSCGAGLDPRWRWCPRCGAAAGLDELRRRRAPHGAGSPEASPG